MSTPSSPQTRWTALWLPRLSTDRLRRAGIAPSDNRPVALYAKIGNAFALTAVDARAEQGGLAKGMTLADARAICPDLAAFAADEAEDARLLNHVAAWCERFSPVVVLDSFDSLFLDVTGIAHLFGGEENLLAEIKRRLSAQGFCVRAAIAPNPAAAFAFAHFSEASIVEKSALAERLATLPIAALRLEPEAIALLRRFGLRRIDELLDRPRQPLAARAGETAMQRLDLALGRAREALSPRRPPPSLFALRRLAEPIIALDAILIAVESLCGDLAEKLDQRGAGAQALRLCLFGVDGRMREIGVRLSRAERDPRAMLRILRERLRTAPENLDAEFGFDALRLDATEIASLVQRPTDLAATSERDPAAEAQLIDALTARLGEARVAKLAVRDDHAPERASGRMRANASAAPAPRASADGVVRRPLTLFSPPQQIEAIAAVPDGPPVRFRWRRVLRKIVRAEGPERIAPNWLRASDERTRDYYRVEDGDGRRYWLYREGFYGHADAPRWFLHGLFP